MKPTTRSEPSGLRSVRRLAYSVNSAIVCGGSLIPAAAKRVRSKYSPYASASIGSDQRLPPDDV